ncbi:MAG: HPr family phosphocarrier protein [Alphaproteobacteria bacterium]|nr:HPr family phosphocarrier protein [Alphaproteobacteria bacterium]
MNEVPAAGADGGHRRIVVICNRRGLHARAAARFVKLADQFEAEITVAKNGTAVSGRSIMGLMMLAAGPGTTIELLCQGPDAERALAALAALVTCGFDEE